MPKVQTEPITRNRATHYEVFLAGWFAGWSMTCEGHNAERATATSYNDGAAGEPVTPEDTGPFPEFLRAQAERAWERYRSGD